MDSQATHPQGHNYEPSGEDHHEKKSVMNKVKAKAKKIKESLTKHGNVPEQDDREHDHENNNDCEEDEDEDMGADQEVTTGAPESESATTRSAVAGNQTGVNLKKPTVMAEDRYDSKYSDPPTRPSEQCQEEKSTEPTANIGRSTAMEEDPHEPMDRPEPGNYQSKAADPTGAGGEEDRISPIQSSFQKMNVNEDQPESKWKPDVDTGSHDQFSPEPLPPHTAAAANPEDPVSANPSDGGGYTEKISSATSAMANKAIAATNVVVAKLGYGGKEGNANANANAPSNTGEGEQGAKSAGSTAVTYGHTIVASVTEKLAPVYEKVADVGSSVKSKFQGTAAGSTGTEQEVRGGDNKGAPSVKKEYWAEKLKPGEGDKALSEVISESLHKRKEEPDQEKEGGKPVGKVMASEEVGRQLGTPVNEEPSQREISSGNTDSSDAAAAAAANASPTGKGVVDRLKGAVGSWFSAGGDGPKTATPASPGTAQVAGDEHVSSAAITEKDGHGQDGGGLGGRRD